MGTAMKLEGEFAAMIELGETVGGDGLQMRIRIVAVAVSEIYRMAAENGGLRGRAPPTILTKYDDNVCQSCKMSLRKSTPKPPLYSLRM